MNDKDKEAFEWWLENTSSTQEEIEAYEAMSEKERVMFCMNYTWQAACEYKQEEINELQAENKKLREALNRISEIGYYHDYGIHRDIAMEALKEVEE
jgi:hypothetical protein